MIQVAILIIVLLALALVVTAWEYWQLRKSVEWYKKATERLANNLQKHISAHDYKQVDIYMPCGKERLSPVEAMLLLTEYMGVEFYGGDGGPCYVSTEHDEGTESSRSEEIDHDTYCQIIFETHEEFRRKAGPRKEGLSLLEQYIKNEGLDTDGTYIAQRTSKTEDGIVTYGVAIYRKIKLTETQEVR